MKVEYQKELNKRCIRMERRFGEEYFMDNIRYTIVELNLWKKYDKVNLVVQFQCKNLHIMGILKNCTNIKD